MTVDLSELIPSLQREVSAPGLDQLPNATDAEYLGNLSDGFWEAYLDGLFKGYTESDGIVTPTSGTADFPRDLQQLVVFYAGFRIVRNQLRDLKTVFKASAGPVSYETQQAATVLARILDDLKQRRNVILERLGDLGQVDSYYIDAYIARENAIAYGETVWVGN